MSIESGGYYGSNSAYEQPLGIEYQARLICDSVEAGASHSDIIEILVNIIANETSKLQSEIRTLTRQVSEWRGLFQSSHSLPRN